MNLNCGSWTLHGLQEPHIFYLVLKMAFFSITLTTHLLISSLFGLVALLKTTIILAEQHFVNSSMDVNELITMVINMAKLRHVSTSAAPEESKSATADLNDGNRVHEYDSEEPLTFEYDYRTDAVCAALLVDSIQRT